MTSRQSWKISSCVPGLKTASKLNWLVKTSSSLGASDWEALLAKLDAAPRSTSNVMLSNAWTPGSSPALASRWLKGRMRQNTRMEPFKSSIVLCILRRSLSGSTSSCSGMPSALAACVTMVSFSLASRSASMLVLSVDMAMSTDRTSIEALRLAKEKLTMVTQAARADGMPEQELVEPERLRRKMHNTIEDLKGSIRVFCRIRPLSHREASAGELPGVQALDSMTLEVDRGAASSFARSASQSLAPSEDDVFTSQFSFDAVFSPGTQEEIFQDCRDVIRSVFDGYNATIFAYGQTGAGKTHTLLGRPDDPGLAPQMIAEIYSVIDRERERFDRQVTASMLELYRNDLVDLLDGSVKQVNIRTDPEGGVLLENAIEVDCRCADDLSELLQTGLKFRKTAETKMNSESSRSHLILTVQIASVDRDTAEETWGKVQLIDLAGSERLKKSQAVGERQKEAIDINRSLTALGDVIEALTQGHKAVPYRNHKLTQVLQDSLGNTAKTLMFVNCAPTRSNADETLASLRYASRIKRVPGAATPRGGGDTTPRGTPRSRCGRLRSTTPPRRSVTPPRKSSAGPGASNGSALMRGTGSSRCSGGSSTRGIGTASGPPTPRGRSAVGYSAR
mmetsp:Transcript_87550/g.252475  ORF Transcript_87550/g.252475 Transcript_87550/m.252475 type:complete len:621 (+) Transcript_87550:1142-3004(+)